MNGMSGIEPPLSTAPGALNRWEIMSLGLASPGLKSRLRFAPFHRRVETLG